MPLLYSILPNAKTPLDEVSIFDYNVKEKIVRPAIKTDPNPNRPKSEEAHATEASDEPVYVISIAAKLAGLPSWTLRVLDKEGLVRPKRTAKDRRLYSDRDIALLARIRSLTEERGINMNGVKFILEMEGLWSEPDDLA